MCATLSPTLDERLAREAVSWSLHPDTAPDEQADRPLNLAAGNRTAVERAISRLGRRHAPSTTPRGRATHVLMLTLARGDWDW